MNKIVTWFKANKLQALLVLVLLFLILKDQPRLIPFGQQNTMYSAPVGRGGADMEMNKMSVESSALPFAGGGSDYIPVPESPPFPDQSNRMVVRDSNLSLVVDSVEDTQKKIITKAQELGGYMISSDTQNPDEAATGTVIVRVPATRLDQALEYFRSLSVKVVSEYLSGYDVTDQYVDLQARLATLNKTKAKFENILDTATRVEDILNVQREIINVQSQIDSIVGQQQYLEKTAENSKITVYLSTDELALPYAPTEAFRPAVIFKQAVRSLLQSFRSAARATIWIGVYSIIWLPVLLVIIFIKRRKNV